MSTTTEFNFVEIMHYSGGAIKFSAILKNSHINDFNSTLAFATSSGKFYNNQPPKALVMGAFTSTIGLGHYALGGQFTSVNRINHIQPADTEYLFEVEISNNQISSKITRLSDSTVLFADSNRALPFSIDEYKICILNRGIYTTTYRDVKIEL